MNSIESYIPISWEWLPSPMSFPADFSFVRWAGPAQESFETKFSSTTKWCNNQLTEVIIKSTKIYTISWNDLFVRCMLAGLMNALMIFQFLFSVIALYHRQIFVNKIFDFFLSAYLPNKYIFFYSTNNQLTLFTPI